MGSSHRSSGGWVYLTPLRSPMGTPRWRLVQPERTGSHTASRRSDWTRRLLASELTRRGEASHWAAPSGSAESEASGRGLQGEVYVRQSPGPGQV